MQREQLYGIACESAQRRIGSGALVLERDYSAPREDRAVWAEGGSNVQSLPVGA
jgi:hypothetical protein